MSKCERCHKEYDQFQSYGIEGECTECFLDKKNPHGLDLSEEIQEKRESEARIDKYDAYSSEWYAARKREGINDG